MSQRYALWSICIVLLFGVTRPLFAQAVWPSKPIRFIVPNTPGGMMDTFARSLSQHFQEKLGQAVFVENRPGASQAIGLDLAAKAMPDLPPIAEVGVLGYEMSTWLGLSTQAAVPRAIVERLHAEIGAWLSTPQMAERFAWQNLDSTPSTPEQMTERVRNEIPVWAKVMRNAGMEPEQHSSRDCGWN